MGVNISRNERNVSTPGSSGGLSESSRESLCVFGTNPLVQTGLQMRNVFGSTPGSFVQGWPSTGGLYVFQAAELVELEFLGIDRFNCAPRSADQEAEDAHCAQMRRLGAKWYADEWEHVKKTWDVPDPVEPEPVSVFGWLDGGGVWCLTTTNGRNIGLGRVANAVSMNERCDVIQRLGGSFFVVPKDCPDLKL